MKKLYPLLIILTLIAVLSCASDPEKNRAAKEQLPKGNYTLVETTIDGTTNEVDTKSFEAPQNAFMDFAKFPSGYSFNMSATDTITFAKEMGNYLFGGSIFTYDVDGDELDFTNPQTSAAVAYKLEGNRLTLFPDKDNLEKLIFAYTPFEPGTYDAIGYTIQKSANHQIAHKFLNTQNKRPLFVFSKDGTVHIAPQLGIKVFKDTVFHYTVGNKTITFKNPATTKSIDYKTDGNLRLFLNDTIFKRIDLIERKPGKNVGKI